MSTTAEMIDLLGYDPDTVRVPEVFEIEALPPGTIRAARSGNRAVAVARLASGRLVVVDDRCPHDGGRISDGFVEGEHIVCARHGWELTLVEGAAGIRCERACKLRE